MAYRFKTLCLYILLITALLLTQSCKGRKGCIDKQHGSVGTFGNAYTGGATLQAAKGSFGNFLASTIVSMVTNGVYGSAKFWDTKKFFDSSGGVAMKEGHFHDSIIFTSYMAIVNNTQVKLVVVFGVIMYMLFLGLGFIMGTKELKLKDIIGDLFRVSVVLLFISESGWITYYNMIIKPILFGSYYFGAKFSQSLNPGSVATPFAGVDESLGYVLSLPAIEKMVGLFLSGLYGTFTAIVLMYAIVSFIVMNLKGIVLFASNLVICGILLCSGPIFIILLMFERTKDFFKNWFGAVVSCGLQQFMLFMTLVLINHMGSAIIRSALFYEVCWSSILSLAIQVPMPGFIKSFLSIIGINIDYLINIKIPMVNFFAFLDSATNPPPDFMGKIGALIIFSLVAGGTIMDTAIKIATKLSEFSISAADTGMAKSWGKQLSEVQKNASKAASGLAGNAVQKAKLNTVGRITGEYQKDKVDKIINAQRELNKMDKAGETGVLASLKRLSLKSTIISSNANLVANSVAKGNLKDGYEAVKNLRNNKDENKDHQSYVPNLIDKATVGSTPNFFNISNKEIQSAAAINKEVYDRHFTDNVKQELKSLESSNKNEYDKRLAEVSQDFVEDVQKNGSSIIRHQGDSYRKDGMTQKQAEDLLKHFRPKPPQPDKKPDDKKKAEEEKKGGPQRAGIEDDNLSNISENLDEDEEKKDDNFEDLENLSVIEEPDLSPLFDDIKDDKSESDKSNKSGSDLLSNKSKGDDGY